MVCVSCGANLPSNPHFCPRCHAATSALGPHFVQAEKRLALLRHRHQSGQLDSAAFTQEVQKLIIWDEDGRLWWLGDQPGEWHWHDGQQWLRGQPQPRTQTAANTPVSPDLTPPVQRGGYKKWAIAGGLILILVAVALGAVWVLSNRTTGDQPFLAIAFSETSPQSLTVYIGEPDNHPFQLPTGDYYIEAVDGNGRVHSGWQEIVPDQAGSNSQGAALTQLPPDAANEEAAAQLHTLAHYLLSVKGAELAYLEAVSTGFQAPLFTNLDQVDWEPFHNSLDAIDSQDETQLLQAIEAFTLRAGGSKTAVLPHPRATTYRRAARRSAQGVFDSLLNAFNLVRDTRWEVREEIAEAFDEMTPQQQKETLANLNPGHTGGAKNVEDFLANLSRGSLNDQVFHIHRDLLRTPNYYETLTTLRPDSNRPDLEHYHRVGGQLVKIGAELEAAVIQEALIRKFPDMAQGFDYADKTNAWAEYVKNAYENPILAFEDAVGNTLKDNIRDRVEQDILAAFPGITEDVATILADKVTNQVVTASTDLATRVAQGPALEANENEVEITSETEEDEPLGTDWIPLFIAAVRDELAGQDYDPVEMENMLTNISACLTREVEAGATSDEQAIDNCFRSVDACLAPADAYSWSFENLFREDRTDKHRCNSMFTVRNNSAEPLVVVHYRVYDNGAMHSEFWRGSGKVEPNGGIFEYEIERQWWDNGQRTFSLVPRIVVVRGDLGCSWLWQNSTLESAGILEMHAQSIPESQCQ